MITHLLLIQNQDFLLKGLLRLGMFMLLVLNRPLIQQVAVAEDVGAIKKGVMFRDLRIKSILDREIGRAAVIWRVIPILFLLSPSIIAYIMYEYMHNRVNRFIGSPHR